MTQPWNGCECEIYPLVPEYWYGRVQVAKCPKCEAELRRFSSTYEDYDEYDLPVVLWPSIERCDECGGSGNTDMQDWDDSRAFRKRTCRACQSRGYREVMA